MYEKIKNYLLSSIIPNKIDLDIEEHLIDSGLIDSISVVKLILWFEEEFELELEEDDLNPENFETIQNMCDLIKKRKKNKKERDINENSVTKYSIRKKCYYY